MHGHKTFLAYVPVCHTSAAFVAYIPPVNTRNLSMSTLTDWLVKDCKAFDVRPLRLTIGRATYEAAAYKRTVTPPAGAHNPAPYVDEAIYVIGRLPSAYRRRKNTTFRFEGDARDWFVACYMSKDRLAPEFAPFHPFGETFILAPWEVPSGDPIDKYNYWRGEHKSYTRIPVCVG